MEKRCYVCQKYKSIDEFYKVKDKIFNICLHDRNRLYCVKHNKKKSKCKECGGVDLCIHSKEKYDCPECNGSGICEHKTRKRTCVICDGSQICEHKKHKNRCIDCNGSQICDHKKIKYLCNICDGKGICEHKIGKKKCKICDPINHMLSLQRRRINYIVKQEGLTKNNSTIKYLGCTAQFLFEYIQKQLTDEMKINGYDIDHIKPISKFNLSIEEEFMKCCHYSNLRPMLSYENKHKSNKWNDDDEIEWNKMITRVSANKIA
jgi:hypothetical protein